MNREIIKTVEKIMMELVMDAVGTMGKNGEKN